MFWHEPCASIYFRIETGKKNVNRNVYDKRVDEMIDIPE